MVRALNKVRHPWSNLQRTEDKRVKFRHARGWRGGRRRPFIEHRHAPGLGRQQKPAAATDAFLCVNLSVRGSVKFGLHAGNMEFSIQNEQDRQYTHFINIYFRQHYYIIKALVKANATCFDLKSHPQAKLKTMKFFTVWLRAFGIPDGLQFLL